MNNYANSLCHIIFTIFKLDLQTIKITERPMKKKNIMIEINCNILATFKIVNIKHFNISSM